MRRISKCRCKGVIMRQVNRVISYILGLFFISLGSVLAIKSGLGVSPISSLPFSINKVVGVSIGTASTILFCIYVGIQIILLKRDFKVLQLLQVVFAVLFGQSVDFLNRAIYISLDSIYFKLILCIISIFIIALGVTLTLSAKIVPVAPDGLAQVISIKTNKEFGKIKVYFDCTVVMLSIILLIYSGKGLEGIGLGTILSAIFVGKVVLLINKNLQKTVFPRIYFEQVSN